MNKSWRYNAQLNEYSQQYCIIYFKIAKRLKCHHHKKEMIIVWLSYNYDRGAS